MKYNNNRFIGFFFIVFLAALLSSCSGLPDLLMHEFKLMPKRLVDNEALIKTQKEAFDKLSSHAEWTFFSPYLESEKWIDKFNVAKDELSKAKHLYDTQIEPMADNNEPEEAQAFTQLIEQFNKHMYASSAAAYYADKRIDFLVTTRNTAAELYAKANQQYEKNLSLQRLFVSQAGAATEKYPNKKDDLTERVAGLDTLVKESSDSYLILKTEYNKNSKANYAHFGDAIVALNISTQKVARYEDEHSNKVDELYRSYVKVLADQRVDYYVVIGRATWCEGEYCGSGDEARFPAVQVDAETFEYFDALTINSIAQYRRSWGGDDKLSLKIPQDKWNALRLNYKSGKSSSHDYGEYWVDSTSTKTFHKYIEIVNDKMTEKDWQAVSDDNFWKNYENLGMAIVTKPYGYYEEDGLKDAQPVGMATVAKPVVSNGVATGSNQYGEWRHSNGNSYWHYYGMYRLFGDLVGPRRYSYNDWNSYSGRKRGYGYYGRNDEYGTYGSSTYSSSRYRNSKFATRNPGEVRSAASGKSRTSRSTPSVRGAGSSSRSRGPSGGGK
ncbi:MAG: hypothetical protein OEY06_09675 [Gammaproteobacteria bacterium]|nr:hypothetical protein [Gammaproteobacteria bacterium]